MNVFDEHKNLSKFEKQFLSELLNDIEKRENSIWTKSWNFIESQNAFSGHKYSGMNSLFLEFLSRARSFEDPRFATFNQAKTNGYYIEKGSKGIPIQFFTFINKETKKQWNEAKFQEKVKNMAPEQRKKEADKKVAIVKVFHVFNAKNVMNNENKLSLSENKPLPAFNKKTNTNELIDQFEKILIENMNVNFQEMHSKGAYYTPDFDKVTMPLKEQFHSYEERMAVLLHELGHATGHEKRLNRDLSTTFGDSNYSKEEIKVEMNSVFMTNTLGLEISDEQKENHLIYLDGWGREIKNQPKEFLYALQDSLKIKDYMIEKGQFKDIFLEEKLEINKDVNFIHDHDYKHLVDFQLSHYERIDEVNLGDSYNLIYNLDVETNNNTKTYSNYKDLWEQNFRNDFINDLNNFALDELESNKDLAKVPDLLNKLVKNDKEIKTALKNTRIYEKSIKEFDLDNDGVPDRIDPDDNRSVLKVEADRSLVGNKTDKYQEVKQEEKQKKKTKVR